MFQKASSTELEYESETWQGRSNGTFESKILECRARVNSSMMKLSIEDLQQPNFIDSNEEFVFEYLNSHNLKVETHII